MLLFCMTEFIQHQNVFKREPVQPDNADDRLMRPRAQGIRLGQQPGRAVSEGSDTSPNLNQEEKGKARRCCPALPLKG